MAGKGKNYQITVLDMREKNKAKTVLTKIFFTVKEANEFKAQMEEKYPHPDFTVMREFF
jgi:hypothetical protein